MNTTAFAKALSTLPQQFDEIARQEDGYLLERMTNGDYVLWCKTYHYRYGEYRYAVCGGATHYRTRLNVAGCSWAAHINQPYNPETGSDQREVYAGDSEQAAVAALWEARHDAW